jgi:hypothetical protein
MQPILRRVALSLVLAGVLRLGANDQRQIQLALKYYF